MSILTPFNKKICKFCSNNDLANFIKITGAMGQVLSSFAFIGSIVTNDELPQKQKAFLTAQEAIEGVINVSLFCLFTSKAKVWATHALKDKTNIFFPNSTKKFFRKNKLLSENQDVIAQLLERKEVKAFNNALPTFAGFAGSVAATAIISPIMKNITSAMFLKAKAIKDQKDVIKNNKINAQSLRTKRIPIETYITTVTSPKGMRL